MKSNAIAAGILASVLLLPLAACSTSDKTTTTVVTTDSPGTAETSFIATEVRKGIDQAKQELQTRDINVGSVHFHGKGWYDDDDSNGLPKAVITPRGTLVIAGKPVDATPGQHALLLDYRRQLIGIDEAGMDIGASGADIGVTAAKQAILGAFSGKSDKEIEASIRPQTDQIQAAALRLCRRLPGLLASQRKLAAAMPAFQPYATMTQKDVDDCGKDIDGSNGKKGFAVFSG